MNRMKISLRGNKIVEIWLFLFIWMQTITHYPLFSVGSAQSMPLHWHHLFGFFGLVMMVLFAKKIRVPVNTFTILYVYAALLTLIGIPSNGIGSEFIKMLYAFTIYIVVYNLCESLDDGQIERVVCAAGLLYAVLVAINMLLNLSSITETLLGHIAHPDERGMITLIGGGTNIEASYLAYFSPFFLKRKKYWYWLFALVASLAFASRVGIILCAVAMLFCLFSQTRRLTINHLIWGIILLVAGGILLTIGYNAGLFNSIISRFLSIGSDGGSTGRLRMWNVAPAIFSDHPLGCGFGNAIGLTRNYTGVNLREGNIHNVYLQFLLELGIPGLIMLIVVAFQTGVAALKANFQDPKLDMLLVFFISYFIQGTGTESIVFVMVALVHISRRKRRYELRQIAANKPPWGNALSMERPIM